MFCQSAATFVVLSITENMEERCGNGCNLDGNITILFITPCPVEAENNSPFIVFKAGTLMNQLMNLSE